MNGLHRLATRQAHLTSKLPIARSHRPDRHLQTSAIQGNPQTRGNFQAQARL